MPGQRTSPHPVAHRIGDSVRIRNTRAAGLGIDEWLGKIVGVTTDGGVYKLKVRTPQMGSKEFILLEPNEVRSIDMSDDQLQALVDEGRHRLMVGTAYNIHQVVAQLRREGAIHNREQRRALFKRLDQER